MASRRSGYGGYGGPGELIDDYEHAHVGAATHYMTETKPFHLGSQ